MKFIGERRALAAAILAFYFLLYGVLAYSGMVPPLTKALVALAGVYGLAFFALVAGYFWARWYAVGVGLYGVLSSVVGIWTRPEEAPPEVLTILLFLGATHLAATLLLWGGAMSQPYDGQTAWRERFHMDENAVQRLGRSVIRAGLSLPMVMLYAFAPKPDSASMVISVLALALTGVGFGALVKMKTWGVLSLGAAGALMISLAGADIVQGAGPIALLRPALAGGLLLSATTPFFAPIMRWVAAR